MLVKTNSRHDADSVSLVLIERFSDLFCSHRDLKHYSTKSNRGWPEQKRPWGQRTIRSHLEGDQIIGLFPGFGYDLLVFDVDCHNLGEEKLAVEHVLSICDLIDSDPLVYTSSQKESGFGGYRVLYFLDQVECRYDILAFGSRLLRNHKLVVAPGQIEIMALRKPDRLPFGEGSFIVDLPTCEPLYDLSMSAMIQRATDIRESSTVSLGEFSSETRINIRAEEKGSVEAFLIENGLPRSMYTNDALLSLAQRWLGRDRLKPEIAERKLRSWIREHHNGRSNKFNSGRVELIDDQIRRIIDTFDLSLYERPVSSKFEYKRLLRLGDIEQLLRLELTPKLLRAAYSLILDALNRGKQVRSKKRIKEAKLLIRGKVLCNYYDLNSINVWEIEIPWKAFQRFPGFDKRYPTKTRDEFFEIGLITQAAEAHADSGRCKKWFVYFNFSDFGREIVSLDEGMLLLNKFEPNVYLAKDNSTAARQQRDTKCG